MKCLDLTLSTPERNLAADEILLESVEQGRFGEVLRFWEPTEYFVVIGYAGHIEAEVNEANRRRYAMPVLRRSSGGGTVLQGPGCLNYSLVLSIPDDGPLCRIRGTNAFVMNRHREAVEAVLRQARAADGVSAADSEGGRAAMRQVSPGQGVVAAQRGLTGSESVRRGIVTVQGATDLALDGRKFSGNAQRRRRAALLFHGTFLLDLDLDRVEQVLAMPPRQPDYRQNRRHRDFLMNLGLPASRIKQALCEVWNVREEFEAATRLEIEPLGGDTGTSPHWRFK
jgi:lipoate---protein ligase